MEDFRWPWPDATSLRPCRRMRDRIIRKCGEGWPGGIAPWRVRCSDIERDRPKTEQEA